MSAGVAESTISMHSVPSSSFTYSASQMYGATRLFGTSNTSSCTTFLRQRCPMVLHVKRLHSVSINVGEFTGPPELGEPADARPVRFFNPSIVSSPAGLCPRCAYVATVRADVLHQCDSSSPLFDKRWMRKRIATAAFFKGTALLVLDAHLNVLDWTWLISQPPKQIATWSSHGRGHVPTGVSSAFAPPWNQQVYDARLLKVDADHMVVTYNCVSCKFSISPLHLQRELTENGGVRKLQAWATQRIQIHDPWLQGRNQALFVSRSQIESVNKIMVQPWIGVIGSLGVPHYATATKTCYGSDYEAMDMSARREVRWLCGSTAINGTARVERISNAGRGFGGPVDILLIAGRSLEGSSRRKPARSNARILRREAQASAAAFGAAVDKGAAGRLRTSGARISATANLLHIARRSGRMSSEGNCTAFLGIGHLHRGKVRGSRTFRFGTQYTHFWYALSTRPPHRMLASSAEFCIQAAQDPTDCESVQFVSGITRHGDSESIILSYGINDCEAQFADIALERVWEMLIPFDGDSCEYDGTPKDASTSQ